MENMRKFDIKYNYSIIALFSEHSETLIGGSEKAVNKALKNKENPNLDTKGLDVFYWEKPLGTLAVEINQGMLRSKRYKILSINCTQTCLISAPTTPKSPIRK